MTVLAQGGASSAALPRVIATWVEDGFLTDLADELLLEFRLIDATGAAGGWVTDTTRLGTGRYILEFVLAPDAAVGTWYAEWRTGDQAGITPFEVVPAGEPIVNAYATVSAARAEGVPVTYSDARLAKALVSASREIENFTRRRFGARYETVEYNGKPAGIVPLDREVVAVDEVYADLEQLDPSWLKVTNGFYNSGANKLEWRDPIGVDTDVEFDISRFRSGTPEHFYEGRANVRIVGLWGYVEESVHRDLVDLAGQVPAPIVEATLLLAFSKVRGKWATASQGFAVLGPIASERTRDQAVSYAKANNGIQPYTGNADVDRIIAQYRRSFSVSFT